MPVAVDNTNNIVRFISKKAILSKERILNTDGKTTFLGLTDKITLKSEKILYDEENHRLYWLNVLIGDIKNNIQRGEVLLECNYLDLEELIKMRTLLESLETLGAQIFLYEGNREVSMEFLSNTIESYKGIAEDREKIDELMFSDE